MIEEMATIRITEAELTCDVHGVLAKVRSGAEVVVEEDHRPVAVIKTPQGPDTELFDGLPAEAKDAVYRRLYDVLSGGSADQQAALEILSETKAGLPEYFGARRQ